MALGSPATPGGAIAGSVACSMWALQNMMPPLGMTYCPIWRGAGWVGGACAQAERAWQVQQGSTGLAAWPGGEGVRHPRQGDGAHGCICAVHALYMIYLGTWRP